MFPMYFCSFNVAGPVLRQYLVYFRWSYYLDNAVDKYETGVLQPHNMEQDLGSGLDGTRE